MAATEVMRVDTSDAQFTVIQMSDGTSHALRGNDDWAVYPEGGSVGALALALAKDLMEAQETVKALSEMRQLLTDEINDLKLTLNHSRYVNTPHTSGDA